MSKYLVKETKNYFSEDPNAIIIDAFQVLEIVDSIHGKIIIANYLCSGYPDDIEPYFLDKLLEDGYKFSDDEKYKDWINK